MSLVPYVHNTKILFESLFFSFLLKKLKKKITFFVLYPYIFVAIIVILVLINKWRNDLLLEI